MLVSLVELPNLAPASGVAGGLCRFYKGTIGGGLFFDVNA